MIVYTAITNHYDTLKVPLVIDPGVRYVAFLDGDDYDVPPMWEVRRIDQQARNPRVTSRFYKLLPHLHFPEIGVSAWVDASLQITRALAPLLEAVRLFAAFPHPERACIYEEAEAVVKAGAAIEDRVKRQMDAYRSDGYPARHGLFMGGLLLRRHNDPVLVRAGERWFGDVVEYSQRDQLSGMVALWREGLTYEPLQGKIQDYVKYIHHPQITAYRGEGNHG